MTTIKALIANLQTDVLRITHQDPRSVAGGVAVARAAQLLAAGHSAEPELFCEQVAQRNEWTGTRQARRAGRVVWSSGFSLFGTGSSLKAELQML